MKSGLYGGAASSYADRSVEWMFGILMVGWGVYLWLPMPTFNNPQYHILQMIAPEEVWGTFSIGLGAVRLAALTVNGYWRRTPLIRVGCAGIGMAWWITLLFCLLMSGDQNPPAGLVYYVGFTIFEGVSVWRSAIDGYYSKAFRWRRRSRSFA